MVFSFATTWRRAPFLHFTTYTAQCCDILERESDIRGDHVLAWLLRLQNMAEELSKIRKSNQTSEYGNEQAELMLKGIKTQLDEWERGMDPELAETSYVCSPISFDR
jgi:hypothetical protein